MQELVLKEIQYMELTRGEIGPALPIMQWHSMGSHAPPQAQIFWGGAKLSGIWGGTK